VSWEVGKRLLAQTLLLEVVLKNEAEMGEKKSLLPSLEVSNRADENIVRAFSAKGDCLALLIDYRS
jgi:hypothetical protein